MNETKSSLKEAFFKKGKTCRIHDVHGHLGPFYGINLPYNSVEKTIETMDRCGINTLILSHHSSLCSTEDGNERSIEAANAYPGRIFAYMTVNATRPENFRRDLKLFGKNKAVWAGMKFHAGSHGIPIMESKVLEEAVAVANSEKLMVLMHTWGYDKNVCPDNIETLFGKYPDATFILGHACHSEWDKSIRFIRNHPNVYADTCAVVDERGPLDKIVREAGSEKILYGTDFPWFDFNYYTGAVLGADISDEDRENILYRNFERIHKNKLGNLKTKTGPIAKL
ncbi:MAG: amidohydrolase family protein [Victivallales bacterium]